MFWKDFDAKMKKNEAKNYKIKAYFKTLVVIKRSLAPYETGETCFSILFKNNFN